MKLIGISVVTLLSAAVAVQGAYIVSARKELKELAHRIEELDGRADLEGGGARGGFARDEDEGDDAPRRAGGPARLPPPRFVPTFDGVGTASGSASGDPLPLPPGLDSAEAREQLRGFVVAQMQQQREAERQRREEERERREQQRQEAVQKVRQTVAKELGLSPGESQRMQEIFTKSQGAMQALRSKIESGQVQRQDIRREFSALREQHSQDMKALLGDGRVQKLQELQRQNPEIARATMGMGAGRGGPPGGGWGGGPPGGGPPGGGWGGGPPGGGAPEGGGERRWGRGAPGGGQGEGPAREAPAAPVAQ
jgi:hypothetical protein